MGDVEDPLEAAVTNPLAFTVTVAFVNVPTLLLTVARVAVDPEVVRSPDNAAAAVTSPLALTVTDANVPTLPLTVANVNAAEPGPAAVPSPVKAVM